MKFLSKQKLLFSTSLLAVFTLYGCSSDNKKMVDPLPPAPPTMTSYSFEVTVTNLTHSQPLSPVAIVSHNELSLWEIGSSADVSIETMAESGDNSQILSDTRVIDSVSGSGIILPGMSETIILNTSSENALYLSIATMLVNTNDGFTGKTGLDITNMAIGDTISMNTIAFDAGTEGNSELTGSIPGPADGGEGFNAARDDNDYVSAHPGIVSMDDGLSSSVLSSEHKFDNPVIMLKITRL